MTWQQQDPKRSERLLSAGLIVAFIVVLGGLAYVISNRSAPDEDAGKATNTTKVQATTAVAPSSTAASQTTTLGPTTTVATTTTLPPTTTTAPTTTVPTTTTAPAPPGPVREQPDGLFCRDLKARGYDFRQAFAYWLTNGRPARMDADGNGIPCETVYPSADVKKKPRARK